jgi:hypothetical protein
MANSFSLESPRYVHSARGTGNASQYFYATFLCDDAKFFIRLSLQAGNEVVGMARAKAQLKAHRYDLLAVDAQEQEVERSLLTDLKFQISESWFACAANRLEQPPN